MEKLSNLSYEILFQILLELPYTDIESYCLTSRRAQEICQSEYFWKQKAKTLPFPLSVIPGETPMRQYMIIESLLRLPPGQAARIAIANGYVGLIHHFLDQEFSFAQIREGLIETIRKNNFNSVVVVRDLLLRSPLKRYFTGIFNAAYVESIWQKRLEIQEILKDLVHGNGRDVLEAAFSTGQFNLTEEIMDELDQESAEDLLDDLMRDAITNDDLDLVQYLVSHYRDLIDLDSHLRAAERRDHYSIASYLKLMSK